MPPNLARTWAALEEREVVRALYAREAGVPVGQGRARAAPELIYYSTLVARANGNREANRYSNVLPYDRTLVAPDGEYVNASVVVAGSMWWVAAQAPLPNNLAAFFRNIYRRTASRSPLVMHLVPSPPPREKHAILVQLTGWTERGTPKADPYMPHGTQAQTFHSPAGPIHLAQRSTETRPNLGATYTELELADAGCEDDPMVLHHYYYGAWPDHGVPEGKAVSQLRTLVLEVRELAQRHACEVWVHCSAGVGRTGTFIALSAMLDGASASPPPPLQKSGQNGPYSQSPLGPLKTDDVIAQTVDELREHRCMLVQTPQQLALLYQVLGQ